MKYASCIDLVGKPYVAGGTDPDTGVDCLWVVHEMARRIFPDFGPAEIPLDVTAFGELTKMRDGQSRWRPIGTGRAQATRIGDILVGTNHLGGTFVAILVDEDGAVAASAVPDRGVFLASTRRLTGVSEIYRRRPSGAV